MQNVHTLSSRVNSESDLLSGGRYNPGTQGINQIGGLLGVNQPMGNYTYEIRFDNSSGQYFGRGQDELNIPAPVRIHLEDFLNYLNGSCLPWRYVKSFLDFLALVFISSAIWIRFILFADDVDLGAIIGLSIGLPIIGLILLISNSVCLPPVKRVMRKAAQIREDIGFIAPLSVITSSRPLYTFLCPRYTYLFLLHSRDFLAMDIVRQNAPIAITEVNFDQYNQGGVLIGSENQQSVPQATFEVPADRIVDHSFRSEAPTPPNPN